MTLEYTTTYDDYYETKFLRLVWRWGVGHACFEIGVHREPHANYKWHEYEPVRWAWWRPSVRVYSWPW